MSDGRDFDWRDVKAASNLAKHGASFDQVRQFDFDAAVIVEDNRRDYGETRMMATGPVGMRLHVLVYTMRGDTTWVISLRKANRREIRRYAREVQDEP